MFPSLNELKLHLPVHCLFQPLEMGFLLSAGSAFRVFPPLFVADVIAVSVFLTSPLFLALPLVNATSVSVVGFPSFACLAEVLVPATVFLSTAFVVGRVVRPFFATIGVSGEGIVVVRMRVDAARLGDDFDPLADGFFFGGMSQGKAQPV
jgi:hypothetical protein